MAATVHQHAQQDRHKILRQVLELDGCPAGSGPMLQAMLRQAFDQRLLPLIEQACADLGRRGHVDRIARLEIDLGRVPLADLDRALGERLETCLHRALAAAIRAAPPADDDLELFEHFLASGGLPWWADRADRQLLDANLRALLDRAPQAVRQALRAARAPRQAWRRLALAYPDDLLDQLADSLASGGPAALPASGSAWLALLQRTAPPGSTAQGLRTLWWEEVLRALAAGAPWQGGADSGVQALLARVARRLGTDYPALLAGLHRALQAGAVAAPVRQSVGRLWRALDGAARRQATVPGPRRLDRSARAALLQGLAWVEQLAAPDAGLWARLRAVIDRLPVGLQAQAAQALQAASGPAGGAPQPQAGLFDALAALVAAALAQGLLGADLVERQLAGLQPPAPALRPAAARSALARVLRAALPPPEAPAWPAEAHSHPAAAASADGLGVDNAGLVLLWPFLATFFQRLGLADDQCFVDAAAAQRGVGLLQYLAAADASPPEPLLPLNKLLCGLAPEVVFDFGPPLSAAEIDACDGLLGAVIQQAPVLHGMSLAGLRGNFLLRAGQVSGRDGHLLLRVERLTHDIVLERIPWGVQFVKLPWMPALMQVEW